MLGYTHAKAPEPTDVETAAPPRAAASSEDQTRTALPNPQHYYFPVFDGRPYPGDHVTAGAEELEHMGGQRAEPAEEDPAGAPQPGSESDLAFASQEETAWRWRIRHTWNRIRWRLLLRHWRVRYLL